MDIKKSIMSFLFQNELKYSMPSSSMLFTSKVISETQRMRKFNPSKNTLACDEVTGSS
jgi:hypothetical protein